MKKFLAMSLLLFLFFESNAQVFTGKVFLRDHSQLYLNQVYVTNLNTQKTVLSQYDGQFSIYAKAGDVLRFTSIVTERKDVKLSSQMFAGIQNMFELRIAYYEIEEVVIARFKPTGNLKKDVLSLKVNDKGEKVKKAIGLPEPKGNGLSPELPIADFRDGGLTFSIESIYDIISGERKKKQRLREYEKMMMTVESIQKYFGNEFFTSQGIPENFITNFLQFVHSSDNLWSYVQSGNYEATIHYIEKYLPIYHRRLKNSSLIDLIDK